MVKGCGEVMGGSRFKFRCGEKRKKLFPTWRDKQTNANGVHYGLSNTQMGNNFPNCRYVAWTHDLLPLKALIPC